MDPLMVFLVVAVVVGLIGYRVWRKKQKQRDTEAPTSHSQISTSAPAPVAPTLSPIYFPQPMFDHVPPSAPPRVEAGLALCDPLGAGFANRAQFDVWATQFQHALFLDGAYIKDGFGPSLGFVTQPDGRITRA